MTDKWKAEARQEIEQRIGMGIEKLPGEKEWVYEAMRAKARCLELETQIKTLREALLDADHLCKWLLQSETSESDRNRVVREYGIKFAALAATEPKP